MSEFGATNYQELRLFEASARLSGVKMKQLSTLIDRSHKHQIGSAMTFTINFTVVGMLEPAIGARGQNSLARNAEWRAKINVASAILWSKDLLAEPTPGVAKPFFAKFLMIVCRALKNFIQIKLTFPALMSIFKRYLLALLLPSVRPLFYVPTASAGPAEIKSLS